MPKISIIVPVYKVGAYLDRCVESVLAQTFTDFELILVDDGSPDNCPQMCDAWAEKDSRIVVIHKPNGGLSDARNAGIDWAVANSNSEWLTFIDGDDWVHYEYLQRMYNAVIANGVNLCVCCFVRTDNNDADIRNENFPVEIYEPEKLYTTYRVTSIVAWGKLYKKECFLNVRYPVGKIHEDEFTTYKIIFKNERIAFISAQMYFYFNNSDGITQGCWSIDRLNKLLALFEQLNFFRKNGYKNAETKCAELYMSFFKSQINILLETDLDTTVKKKVLKEHSGYLRKFLRIYKNKYSIENYPQHYRIAYHYKSFLK